MRNLAIIRRRKGMSQTKLAELTGISQHSISKIETGNTTPRPETVEKLAAALDVEDPRVLAAEVPDLITFDEVLEWPPERRRLYFELDRELGRLGPFIEQLERHYAEGQEQYQDDLILKGRLEAAYMLGFAKGYHEGRTRKGDDGET